jgi:asparagine synthase (glutamine-hydrolysing)
MKKALDIPAVGYPWTSRNGVSVRGYLFDITGRLYHGDSLAAYFNVNTTADFVQKLKQANGFFAVMISRQGRGCAAVDRIRSLPLFYSRITERVSDHIAPLLNALGNPPVDPISLREFFATGYVTGPNTLYPDLYQLQAGEWISTLEGEWQQGRYYRYLHTHFRQERTHTAQQGLLTTLRESMTRLIRVADHRPIVLPLSGGYDSRLLAILLKEAGVSNVSCFTYGRHKDAEVETSRRVATHLGFAWQFIDLKPVIRQSCRSKSAQDYLEMAHQGVTAPHLQDFPVIEHLKQKNLIPPDALIVPGHTGDFIGGKHTPTRLYGMPSPPTSAIVDAILNAHYRIYKPSRNDSARLRTKIETLLPASPPDEDPSSRYEAWEWQERQAKFIVHSVRIYEYFGYQWSLPLWDFELVDFFRTLPFQYRKHKALYNEAVAALDPDLNRYPANPKVFILTKQFRKFTSIHLKRYTLKDWLWMVWLSIRLGDFTIPDAHSVIHKLKLVTFKRLFKQQKPEGSLWRKRR